MEIDRVLEVNWQSTTSTHSSTLDNLITKLFPQKNEVLINLIAVFFVFLLSARVFG